MLTFEKVQLAQGAFTLEADLQVQHRCPAEEGQRVEQIGRKEPWLGQRIPCQRDQPEPCERLDDPGRRGENPVGHHHARGNRVDGFDLARAHGPDHLKRSADAGAEKDRAAEDVQPFGHEVGIHQRSSSRMPWITISTSRAGFLSSPPSGSSQSPGASHVKANV